jgi:uncharacterized membrane protein
MINELITTIVKRPYVFAFLAAYLFLAWRLWGWRRTIFWLVSGYLIAWASEFSSINNGFPYGWYFYRYENMPGELMVGGVPFFDSLSYPFLIFAGYSTALFILSRGFRINFLASNRATAVVILIGSTLTMLLDIVIDPVAKLGSQWFLGNIYWYSTPGWYFGIPISNFMGWFLVPLAVIVFNMLAWHLFPNLLRDRRFESTTSERCDVMKSIFPAFYASIALFNISISFWIGAWKIGVASSCILLGVIAIILKSYRSKCTQ